MYKEYVQLSLTNASFFLNDVYNVDIDNVLCILDTKGKWEEKNPALDLVISDIDSALAQLIK